MPTLLDAEIVRDGMAVSMARAVVIANRRAVELGIDVNDRLVSVAQRLSLNGQIWQVHYVPKEYIGRRGGDFTIEVDSSDGAIKQELRGQ